jgi:hypothetical protein
MCEKKGTRIRCRFRWPGLPHYRVRIKVFVVMTFLRKRTTH